MALISTTGQFERVTELISYGRYRTYWELLIASYAHCLFLQMIQRIFWA